MASRSAEGHLSPLDVHQLLSLAGEALLEGFAIALGGHVRPRQLVHPAPGGVAFTR